MKRNRFSTLEKIETDTSVFIDAPIFIYHFTGASPECKGFLGRCERGDVRGMTSVVVLAEVAHRMMTIEAVAKGLITPGNVVKKLREKPEVVSALHDYQEQVEKIPLMFVDVIPLEIGLFLRSAQLRKEFGLLVNDSLAAASALEANVTAVASADSDLGRVRGLTLYRPSDLTDADATRAPRRPGSGRAPSP